MCKIFLIIGNCGVGKTWVMKGLLTGLNINPNIYSYKTGLYNYVMKDGVLILGKYDGSVFEGSDRLSMSVMSANNTIQPIFNKANYIIGEGDRFTNSTFVNTFKPVILKINGDGELGRQKRGSAQTERHLKSISTRVANIHADLEFKNSEDCLSFLLKTINNDK